MNGYLLMIINVLSKMMIEETKRSLECFKGFEVKKKIMKQ